MMKQGDHPMYRSATLASVLAVGLAAPAIANESSVAGAPTTDRAAIDAFTGQLSWLANQHQMRKFLAYQGYIVTSDLNRNDKGYWVGTALKDGTPMRIALKMPPRMSSPEALTN
jgi:hypothetical protein